VVSAASAEDIPLHRVAHAPFDAHNVAALTVLGATALLQRAAREIPRRNLLLPLLLYRAP
jgi:hypothetical protein